MKEVLSRHGSLVNQDNGSAVTFGLVLVTSVTVRRERSVVQIKSQSMYWPNPAFKSLSIGQYMTEDLS